MTELSNLTEIAVAASLATRECPHLDHDEIGILAVRAYKLLPRNRDGVVPARDIADQIGLFDKALTTRVVERAERAPLGSEANPVPVVDNTVNDFDRAARLRGEGMLLMRDAGGSAQDPALFARTIELLDKDGIFAHTSDAIDASVEAWSEMREASLSPLPDTHEVIGSTVVMEAMLEIVEADGTIENVPVLVTVQDIHDALSSPVIDLLPRGRETLAETAFATRIAGMHTEIIRQIADSKVDKFSHGWEEVDAVTLVPIADSYEDLGPGRGVSMLVTATFVFTDKSQTQGRLSVVMPRAGAPFLTGRITA